MPPDHPRTAEALLSQSDWVRALVRGLGVDESGAEDVVQSTWLAALSSPPRSGAEGASFRAWIARVARNFALRRIDRDARRAGRERASAKEERLPSAADVVEREEARAEVVQALLDVHEPFRTALLLRFYEGLEPRDIARLQSVPASTVRNRLKRGLALLRERLEASQGPTWRQRCLLVLPLIHPKPIPVPPASYPTAAAAASGGALVIKSLGIAATVALAAGGAYFTWHHGTSSSVPASGQASARSASASGSAGSAPSAASGTSGAASHSRPSRADAQLVAATPASARAPVAEAAETAASAEQDDGRRCAIHGRLLRPDGTPLAFAKDRALRMESTMARKEQELALFDKIVVEDLERRSGSDARQSAHPTSEESLVDESIGLERKKVEQSREADRRKVELLQQKIRVEHDLAPTAPSPEAQDKIKVEFAFEPVFSRPPHVLVASAGGDARELDVDAEGNFAFGDLRPDRWHLFATAPGFLTKRMEFEIRRGEAQKQLDVVLESSTKLRVKLATPDGRDLLTAATEELGDRFAPVPFAMRTQPGPRIAGLDAESEGRVGSGRWRGRQGLDEAAVGDASGVLELADPLPLHVGIAACGVVLEERLVAPGAQEIVFVVPLDRIRALASGVLVQIVSESDARPMAGASVRIEGFAGTVTSEDGVAELAGIPPGMHEIRFFAEGTEQRAEWVSVAPGAKTDLGVRPLGPPIAIHGRVVDEDGAPVEAKVLLRSTEGGSPVRELAVCDAAATDAEGRFVLEKAGRRKYVLTTVSRDRAAPIEIVDVRDGIVPEIVVHAAPCIELALTFPIEPPPGASYVVETTDGLPVHVQPADGWRSLVARLGNGDYLAKLLANGATLWTRHVLVRPGQMMAFDDKPSGR